MKKIWNSKIVLLFAVVMALTLTKGAYADENHASFGDVVVGVSNAISNVAAAQNAYANQQLAMNGYYLAMAQHERDLQLERRAEMERIRHEQEIREHLRHDRRFEERQFDYHR